MKKKLENKMVRKNTRCCWNDATQKYTLQMYKQIIIIITITNLHTESRMTTEHTAYTERILHTQKKMPRQEL